MSNFSSWGWASALIVLAIAGVALGAVILALDEPRSRRLMATRKPSLITNRKAAPASVSTIPVLHDVPIIPRGCVLAEIDDAVMISALARALASGGLSISNTTRGTLRIHLSPDAPRVEINDQTGNIVRLSTRNEKLT